MSTARTIANWMISLVLIMGLTVAPAAAAYAACMPAPQHGAAMDTKAKPPCDTPCKDCAKDDANKVCKGDCVCVKTMIASPLPLALAPVRAAKLAPAIIHLRIALVHPPDTPPPRSLLA